MAVPTAATSNQPGFLDAQACHAPSSARAAPGSMTLGFQMNVEKRTSPPDVAAIRAAASPATRPPIERATHHTIGTTANPATAISVSTHVGSSPPSQAAGIIK